MSSILIVSAFSSFGVLICYKLPEFSPDIGPPAALESLCLSLFLVGFSGILYFSAISKMIVGLILISLLLAGSMSNLTCLGDY